MRVLVTGIEGFAGRHLTEHLERRGDVVFGLRGPGAGAPPVRVEHVVADVRIAEQVAEVVSRAQPDAIVHLAAIASVAQSHVDPRTAFEVNALGVLNLCLAVKAHAPRARLLLVSSGEVYGALPPGEPASERRECAPTSPYAASKVAGETIGLQFARSYGMHVVCARPFNHLGAGQAPGFAIPSFARQLVGAKAGSGVTLSVGNLDPVRDFSHVKDVVASYGLLLDRGVSGEAYNIASGRGRSIREVLDELIALTRVDARVHVDPEKLRPADIPWLVGDPAKLRALGWAPQLTLGDALADVLADARGGGS
jgi:GDP-4-dehydro-6-deoxy-D-mannose reductase